MTNGEGETGGGCSGSDQGPTQTVSLPVCLLQPPCLTHSVLFILVMIGHVRDWSSPGGHFLIPNRPSCGWGTTPVTSEVRMLRGLEDERKLDELETGDNKYIMSSSALAFSVPSKHPAAWSLGSDWSVLVVQVGQVIVLGMKEIKKIYILADQTWTIFTFNWTKMEVRPCFCASVADFDQFVLKLKFKNLYYPREAICSSQ